MFNKVISAIASIVFSMSIANFPVFACEADITRYAVWGTIESKVCDDVDDGAIIDDMGYEWYYYGRPELYEGERVLVVFHDNGTPSDLCDDVIIEIVPADNCFGI